ncbi:condensin complex protein MksE [Pseudoalteromonas sp. SSDWG2]|uniref:condensin complex protein MksE n=1 Tax=Pseudoalteromonas sp. SSDWG2 TaxID=3139391 RepID=UPI003BADBA26
MSTLDLSQLTQLQYINKKLVSGYHISEQDNLAWQELDQHQQQYDALFTALGHNLVHDARGFFYFASDEGTANMGKISRAIALFIYTLIEQYANKGQDPMRALFDKDVDLEVCQELVLNNKALFDQLEIFSGTDLRKDVLMRMVRLGMAKAKDKETLFRILAPIHRYLDALLEVNDDAFESAEEV